MIEHTNYTAKVAAVVQFLFWQTKDTRDLNQTKLNLLLYSLYYAEAWNRVCGAHILFIALEGNTAPYEEMLHRLRAVGNTESNLTDSRFEQPETNALSLDQLSCVIKSNLNKL